ERGRYSRIGSTEERSADVRVVASSNRDLYAMVQAGTFREDLYFRLDHFSIRVPPLRERPEDIVVLAAEFLRAFATRYWRAAPRARPPRRPRPAGLAAAAHRLHVAGQRPRAQEPDRAVGPAHPRRRSRSHGAAPDAAPGARASGSDQDPDRNRDGRGGERGH